MPKSRPPYPPEFRQRIIEPVRKGRTPESLAEQFEPSAQTIRNWLAQADRDAGQRADGLTTDEREKLRRLRRENKTLREEREILKKSRGLVCQGDRLDPIQGFEFVTAHRATHRLATLCRVLGVSPSGYYAWRRRPLSPRARGDVTLSAQIQAIHTRPAGTSGGSRPARQGCQYREAGVRPSMGTMGDAYDNALCESFFATLECELQDRRRFPTQAEARMAVFDFIAGWYNPHRRHSGLDYLSPIS